MPTKKLPSVHLKRSDDRVEDVSQAIQVLRADGVASRKREVAPAVTNQQWPGLVEESAGIIIETAIRLRELETLIKEKVCLYAKDLPDVYERRIENLGVAPPRPSIGVSGEPPRILQKGSRQ